MSRARRWSLLGPVLAAASCQTTPSATTTMLCPQTGCTLPPDKVRWAVAIDPPPGPNLAPTQLAERDIRTGMAWTVDSVTQVLVRLSPPANAAPVPPQAQVTLSIPAGITGLPDLSFQAPVGALPDGRLFAVLNVPSTRVQMNAAGLLTLQPVPPGDRTLPPYRWAVKLSATIDQTLPGDDFLMRGQLLDANNKPLKAGLFAARAFQNGLQVSNTAPVVADGTFEIRIPSDVATAAVELFLAPAQPPQKDPWFLSSPLMPSPGLNIGTINLPAYVAPSVFSVATVDAIGTPIGGAPVAAQAALTGALIGGVAGGTAVFAGFGITDETGSKIGSAQLSLLPGAALSYAISSTPSIGSPYASACVSNVSGATDPNGGNLKSITLGVRPMLSGVVLAYDGTPVPSATVTASGTPDPPNSNGGCVPPPPVTSGTTTDVQGNFELPLDKGTYRVDIDPPPGAFAPRQTYPSVMVPVSGSFPNDPLPQPTWLSGHVVGPDGAAIAWAAIRFFAVCSDPTTCPGGLSGATLVAATVTGSDGGFQIAVPLPAGT